MTHTRRWIALMVSALLLSGCGFLPVLQSDPGAPGSPLRITAPVNKSQLTSTAGVPVALQLASSVDRPTLRITLVTGTELGNPVDVTARFATTGATASATLGAADIRPGLSVIDARAATTQGQPLHVSVVFSWEPGLDVRLANRCEIFGQPKCLLPFPSNAYTVADPTSDTGRRVHFDIASMPTNTSGVHVDPTEWNRNDGFSPGSPIVVQVPGVDLGRTGAAPITDLGKSLEADQPIVIVDAATGERWPYFAELDANAPNDASRALIIRPARNFLEGHRYLVALRRLEDAGGATIPAGRAFSVYRDWIPTFLPAVEARRPQVEDVLQRLRGAGVARGDLYLAWDFTVASERNLSERVLRARDDAFASLGAAAPGFTVTAVQDNVDANILRRVTGTFQVPLYLTGTGAPGSRFNTGPDGLPARNGTFDANFVCNIPRSVATNGNDPVVPGRALVYGHGLLGRATEVNSFGASANTYRMVMCATDWIGMSGGDVANVASILVDFSKFPTLADRVQQGLVNFQFLARLMKMPTGFAANPAFRVGASNSAVIAPGEVFFNGNSQGGIIGGAATAISTEWTRAVLGVPADNYSVLLPRSIDWESYAVVFNASYPDALDRSLSFAILQMLWDRAEGNGYAQHLTDDPLPGTPPHQVLLEEAFGDHQVANIGTEIEARTIGARVYQPALRAGRDTAAVPFWGIPPITTFPYTGSAALVTWDYGTPAPPITNTPPHAGVDPHGLGGANPRLLLQVSNWLQHNGSFVDVCNAPCVFP